MMVRSMMQLKCLAVLAIGGALVLAGTSGRLLTAAEPDAKTAKQKSLDDALLEDLDNELLEGAGDLKSRSKPAAEPASKADPADVPEKGGKNRPAKDGTASDEDPGEAPRDLKDAIDSEDIGLPSKEEDPLSTISQEMRTAESWMPQWSKRQGAADMQKRILEDLNHLIEQAEQQAAAQKSNQDKKQSPSSQRQMVQQPKSGQSGKDSNKPAEDSTDRLGKAEQVKPDLQARKGMMKDSWGHLPEHAREQMLQNPPEQFLPRYELLIERYYKRLAEERNAK